MIEIIHYENRYHPVFKRLNLGWLDAYHLAGSHNLEIVNEPVGKVMTGSGCIFPAIR